jgi:NADH dehydrogenase
MVVVLGGSGFVGRALCRQLSQLGRWRIVVLTRGDSKCAPIAGLPNVFVEQVDVFDVAALRRMLQAADAVVNLVAILHGSSAQFHHVHIKLPELLGREIRRVGGRRLVHVSALGVSEPGTSAYLQSKSWGERLVKGEWPGTTVLRPSVIFGAEDRFINTFARLQRFVPFIPLACSGALFQPVWVEDVASAIAACLDRGATAGRIYQCAGPAVLTLRDVVGRAGSWAGVERPILPLPLPIAHAQAWLMELMPGEPLMSRDNIRSMQTPNVSAAGLPSLQDLGIAPRALDDYLARITPSDTVSERPTP